MRSADWLELIVDIPAVTSTRWESYSDEVASQFPFGQIWEGLSEKFWKIIANEMNCVHLSDMAIACLKRDLALQLSHICSVPIWEFYQKVILCKAPYLMNSEIATSGAYEYFYAFLWKGGLREFYTEYHVVADRCLRLLSLWSSSVAKFISDFCVDLDSLRREFVIGDKIAITGLNMRLSDMHNGGKSVIGVEIGGENGVVILYKPKNLGPEVLFRNILRTLGEPARAFDCANTLNCGDHGWVSRVKHCCAKNNSDIEDYYKKAGAVLCVSYVLRLTDLHAENIIAQGNTPQLIDMEAMFHPFFIGDDSSFTVLSTGLLPPNSLDHTDIFGLTAIGGETSKVLHCRWKDLEKNNVRPEFVEGKFAVLDNLPTLDGKRISAHSYVDCICDGFSIAYEALSRNARSVSDIILDALQDDAFEVRVIPRSTMQYSLILRNLAIYHYRDIKSARSYIEEALVQGLYYPALGDENIRRAEIDALERLDVPCFRARIKMGDIAEYMATINKIDIDIERFMVGTVFNMSVTDKNRQIQLIRESFL